MQRRTVDVDHVWNFGVRQSVRFDLLEPPHPRHHVRPLEHHRHRCSSLAHEIANDPTKRPKQGGRCCTITTSYAPTATHDAALQHSRRQPAVYLDRHLMNNTGRIMRVATDAMRQGFPTLFWRDTPPSILVDR